MRGGSCPLLQHRLHKNTIGSITPSCGGVARKPGTVAVRVSHPARERPWQDQAVAWVYPQIHNMRTARWASELCGAVLACVRVPPTYASGAGLRGERLCCIALEPQAASG